MKGDKDISRGLFYTRDSGGRHEMTPGQYVEWAQRRATEFNVSFDGTPDRIGVMIRTGLSVDGDLFLDYEVAGNLLSRPGLNALIREAEADERITHIFIPRRDRLARPDDPIDGILLEARLRKAGKALVFMDRYCPPLPRGKRAQIADTITSLIEYDSAGRSRSELGTKMIYAQIALANAGFSTGGRAPYAFRRWLAKDDGTPIRQLADGECVRMLGHHVVWLPGPEQELKVVRRILEMLKVMPATQVAAILTKERVPTPDHGRYRKDSGVRHGRSGVWHPGTVTSIARNPLLVAVVEYGRRSMGDQVRFGKDGPRELDEHDFRLQIHCAHVGL